MFSVSVSRIRRETLYTQSILRACRADPGLSVLIGYHKSIILYLGLLQVKHFLFFIKKSFFFLRSL